MNMCCICCSMLCAPIKSVIGVSVSVVAYGEGVKKYAYAIISGFELSSLMNAPPDPALV
jgi:hypothetical protein